MPLSFFERVGRLTLGDDDDALLGHGEPTAEVVLPVVADHRVLGNAHLLVDDGSPNACAPADIHAAEQNRILHPGITIDPYVRRQDAVLHHAAAEDAALTDNAVERLAAPA